MELIIIGILFIATLVFVLFFLKYEGKRERTRFREFVLAAKSEDLQEYVESLPTEGKIPEPEPQDEFAELDTIAPEALLKAVRK